MEMKILLDTISYLEEQYGEINIDQIIFNSERLQIAYRVKGKEGYQYLEDFLSDKETMN